MNKYLQEVWQQLKGIPKDDAKELLEYYEEYFLDAGMSLEQVEAKYGKPKKFAQQLMMTYYLDKDDEALASTEAEVHPAAGAKPRMRLVWLIILSLFASPLLVPLALGVLLAIVLVLLAILACLLAFYAAMIGLIVVGAGFVVTGFGVLTQSMATMDFFVGLGLLGIGLGLLLGLGTVKVTRLAFSAFVNFVKWIGRKISRRRISSEKEAF